MPDTNMNVDVARFGSFRSCAVTHAGMANRLNEDAYVNRPDLGVWAVADGAGGHGVGPAKGRAQAELVRAVEHFLRSEVDAAFLVSSIFSHKVSLIPLLPVSRMITAHIPYL